MPVPKVSVLIPTYRYARYLTEAVESVLAQDFADFELIISDDCSDDGSREILEAYASRDPRIRIQIHGKNVGMVQNWNWCLGAARGEFVKYVFGDDRLAQHDALGKLVLMLETNPAAALASSARNLIDEHSVVIGRMDGFSTPGVHDSGETIYQCLARGNIIGEPSAVIFRRAAAARGFSTAYGQLVDLEMWLHLLQKGPLALSSEALCDFRRHPLQQTETNRKSQIDRIETLRLMLDYAHCSVLAGRDVRALEFIRLYDSRKTIHDPGVVSARQQLMERFGKSAYRWRWLLRKLQNPFRSLIKSAGGKSKPPR